MDSRLGLYWRADDHKIKTVAPPCMMRAK